MSASLEFPLSYSVFNTASQDCLQPTGLYTLCLRYRDDLPSRNFFGVYVPPSLRPFLECGEVAGFHIECAEWRSRVRELLPDGAKHWLVAVELYDGTRRAQVVESLRAGRRRFLAKGVVGLGVGTVMWATRSVGLPAWAGLPFAAYGLYWLQQARRVPLKEFLVDRLRVAPTKGPRGEFLLRI